MAGEVEVGGGSGFDGGVVGGGGGLLTCEVGGVIGVLEGGVRGGLLS